MSDLSDRAKASLDEYVDRRASKYDYAGVFAYTVVTQNSDGSVDVEPEDPNLSPPLSGVEILYDNPATKITVSKGAQCRVHFVNKDPRRPEAFGFKRGSYKLLEFGDDGFPLARQGDLVAIGGVGLVITCAGAGVLTAGTALPCVLGTVANPIGGWPGYIQTGASKTKGK
jgi:hypothetical protein